MIHTFARKKFLEIVFATVFSTLTLIFFFALLSMNDLVLGNDPAFHLRRAELLLSSGKIPMGDFMWYPPFYHILLASLIAFTGATNIEQMLFLMKALTALINWLLLFSVYLMGTKFFGKKCGVLASALMLLSFPLYEINLWGGYTGILGLTLMCLLFLYLPLVRKDFEPILIIFIITFSLVLSHPLATFLTSVILLPFILFMLIKSKGQYSKAFIAAVLGGAIAFFIYYIQPIMARIDMFIAHVFFEIKAMTYQIPYVTAHSFVINFGFILFCTFFGVFLAFLKLKEKNKMSFYLLLSLNLFVPLLLSQSYLFGLYLPYQRFIYYLLPPMAIFAAVSFSFIIDLFFSAYHKIKSGRRLMKIVPVSIVLAMLLLFSFRFHVVSGKINEGAYFYSTSDLNGYNAALWLKENFPGTATNVTVTEKPGFWFGVYSGKPIIVATNPIIERNAAAETVLDLSYEIEHPLTLARAYEAKGHISDENYISIGGVWRRVSYLSEQGVFLSFRENGNTRYFDLSSLSREIVFEKQNYPKKLTIKYFNYEIVLTESILVQNDSYPVNVIWTLTPLRSEINNVALYISYFFDLYFSFEKAYIPGSLDWANPWSKPSYAQGNEWAVVNFSRESLTENYIGAYDERNEVAFALKFVDLPDWGNVGALSNRQVDAFRFQYQLEKVDGNQTVSFAYQILTFSKDSYPKMRQPSELKNLFDSKQSIFGVKSRSYADYIKEMNIEFLVYDKDKFDSKLLSSNLLQLLYSNDGYVICRIKSKP